MIRAPLSTSYWPSDTSEEVFETTVGSVLRDAAQRSASLAALVEAIPDKSIRRRWTYSDLPEDSERAARAAGAPVMDPQLDLAQRALSPDQ
jgi:acyl-CoA synthetase (AMP-forming)/AMP-acid ligase II